jgi:hypothetical protein
MCLRLHRGIIGKQFLENIVVGKRVFYLPDRAALPSS